MTLILNHQARIVGLKLIEKFKLNLINVYSPNGNPIENKGKFKFKLKWFDELIVVIRKLYKNRKILLIAGDFNVLDE